MNTVFSNAANIARAEWTKWRSIGIPLRYGSAAVGLSILITTLIGLAMNQANTYCEQPGKSCSKPPMAPSESIVTAGILGDGTPGAGLITLMLLGATTVLVEYRYGTLGTAFLATPHRGRLMAVKSLLVGALAFVLAFVSAVTSGLVFVAVSGSAGDKISPLSAQTFAICLRTALVVGLAAAAAVALATVVRNAMAVVAVIVLWPLVLEPLLPSMLPGGSERIAALLPFANARHYVGLSDQGIDFTWGASGSGIYFTALMLAAAMVGTWYVRRVNIR